MRSRCLRSPYLYPGVQVQDWKAALIAALVLGLVNTLIKPILVLLTLPVTMLTLGLFLLVINALLFWGVAQLVEGFQVSRFLGGLARRTSVQRDFGGLLSKLIPDRT